jgi:pentatricopeptide repeat protein
VRWCGEESVDRYTLTSLLQCYCNADRPDDANTVFQRMSERGWVDEHVLTTLLVAFSKWGKVEGAVELVGRMEMLGMKPSERTLSVLIHGFAKQGRIDKAMVVFDKMASYGFSVDLPLYSVLIEGLCQENEIMKAVKLFEEMKKKEIAPDVRLLKKLVEAFCKNGDFVSIGTFINQNSKHMKKQVVLLYNVVLEGFVNHGEVDAGYHLLSSMVRGCQRISDDDSFSVHMFYIDEDTKPNSNSFNIVVCALCD